MATAVIEKVTGESLPTAVGQAVTTPLRLRDARFAVTDMARLVDPMPTVSPHPSA